MLSDVVETLRLFIVLKTPGRFDRLLCGDTVAVEVVKPRDHGWFEIGMIDVEQVTQRVAQLEFVEPPDNRLSTRALAGRVGLLQNGGKTLDHQSIFLKRRLGLLLRWHLSEVELIKNALPGLECMQFGKIGPERVEAQLALLFFRSVALEAVCLEKGSVCLQFRIGLAQGSKTQKK